MKARVDAIIQREQADYLNSLHVQKDPILQEMEAYGHSRSRRSETSRALRQWREQF